MLCEPILIVDDEPKIRFTLSIILKREGYPITAVGTGCEALQLIKSYRFSLVLLDIIMPDIHGITLLHQIRQISPNLPVVILSSDDSLDTTMQALTLGARGYLVKPIIPDQILTCISKLILEQATPKNKGKPRIKRKVFSYK